MPPNFTEMIVVTGDDIDFFRRQGEDFETFPRVLEDGTMVYPLNILTMNHWTNPERQRLRALLGPVYSQPIQEIAPNVYLGPPLMGDTEGLTQRQLREIDDIKNGLINGRLIEKRFTNTIMVQGN